MIWIYIFIGVWAVLVMTYVIVGHMLIWRLMPKGPSATEVLAEYQQREFEKLFGRPIASAVITDGKAADPKGSAQ